MKITSAGADFTKPENEEDESTPLDLAVQAGHGHLVKLVEELSKFIFLLFLQEIKQLSEAIEAANNKGKKGAKKGKK